MKSIFKNDNNCNWRIISITCLIAIIIIGIFVLNGCKKVTSDGWIIGFEYEGKNEELSAADLGYFSSPELFLDSNVKVTDNYVEYKARMILTEMGFSGYSYKIENKTLFINLYADLIPYHAEDRTVDIKIKDKNIKGIDAVVLWDQIGGNHVAVWKRETVTQGDGSPARQGDGSSVSLIP